VLKEINGLRNYVLFKTVGTVEKWQRRE